MLSYYALLWKFQSGRLKGARVGVEMKWRSSRPPTASGMRWHELWMTITKWMTVAICGPGLSARMGSVSACASVCQGCRKTDLRSSRRHACLQRTAKLQTNRFPAFCLHLLSPTTSPSETIWGFPKHFHIITFDFQNNPVRQALQARHQDPAGCRRRGSFQNQTASY